MPKVEEIKILNIDEKPYTVDSLGDEVKGLVEVYNEWSQKEAEVRDELSELEKKLEELATRADAIRKEAGNTSANVIEAAGLAADEIKHGFERIRKLL